MFSILFFILFIFFFFFFFNDTATTAIYTVSDTLSLHALFRSRAGHPETAGHEDVHPGPFTRGARGKRSEEHTSELQSPDTISYAVFCWKKENGSRRIRGGRQNSEARNQKGERLAV